MADKLTLVQKMVEVYKKIDHIEKRGRNKEQSYNYVKSADLAHAVRNALAELGVYAQVTFQHLRSFDYTTKSGTHMNAATVQCNIYFFDADAPTTPTYTATGLGTGSDTGDKSEFKAQTGALKYALRNAFLVPDDTDPEDDSKDAKEETKSSTAKATVGTAPKATTKATPKDEAKPAGVPKSEIPNELPAKTEKAAQPSTKESKASSAPTASNEDDNGAPPSESEMKGFRRQFIELQEKLGDAGLAPTKGNPLQKQALKYLLKTTGASKPEDISKSRWQVFFAVTDDMLSNKDMTATLVEQVNLANGEKK